MYLEIDNIARSKFNFYPYQVELARQLDMRFVYRVGRGSSPEEIKKIAFLALKLLPNGVILHRQLHGYLPPTEL